MSPRHFKGFGHGLAHAGLFALLLAQPAAAQPTEEASSAAAVPADSEEPSAEEPQSEPSTTQKKEPAPKPSQELKLPSLDRALPRVHPQRQSGDLVDTRITFIFSDDDLLHDAGETNPSSPTASFGAREGRIFFFENHNRKDRGDETQSHVVVYRSMEGFLPRLTTEAALVIEFDIGRQRWRDDGTYINLRYDLGTNPKDKVQLTFFPFDTERFQLGYSYRLAWGGSRIFGQTRQGPAPGLKLSLDKELGGGAKAFGFIGTKTAQLLRVAPDDQPQINDELDTFYAGLAGAGVDSGWLRLEANGGYFQKGTNPREHVRGEAVDAVGASVQLAVYDGIPVQSSADFRLYRNDPTRIPPAAKQAPADWGYMVSVEGTAIWQSLEDPTVTGGTKLQRATAGDLNMVLRVGPFEPFADLVYRDLSFVLFNVPSFVPYQDFSDAIEVTPELWAAVGVNVHIPGLHLTPGVVFGIQQPSSVTAVIEAGSNPPSALQGQRTVVIRREGDLTILPDGKDVVPIFASKIQARWDLSPMISMIGEAFVSYDENRSELRDDVVGIPERVFQDPLLFGFSILTQARF